ncbi:MAG: nuclear transport factor 2 family protein [Actinomycetota bacterium]|nr:nuclear transport factor 2 family protein [Actinomycetota bacterium]
MSQENVEIVRRVYDAVSRGDHATVLAAYHPEVEWDFSRSPFRRVMDRRIYRGPEGMRSLIRERYEAWETADDHLEEAIDAGEQVVSVVVSQGRGRASGAEVKQRHHGVWTFRDGKIVRVAWLGTREEALEAAGLPE